MIDHLMKKSVIGDQEVHLIHHSRPDCDTWSVELYETDGPCRDLIHRAKFGTLEGAVQRFNEEVSECSIT